MSQAEVSGKINRVHFYFQMDPKTFYGMKRVIIPVTDISDDENLSDGDENDLEIRQEVLCNESESDTDFSVTGEVIDQTDDTDDDVPLLSRLESARAQYIKKASQNQKEYESSTPSTSFGRNHGGKNLKKRKSNGKKKNCHSLKMASNSKVLNHYPTIYRILMESSNSSIFYLRMKLLLI